MASVYIVVKCESYHGITGVWGVFTQERSAQLCATVNGGQHNVPLVADGNREEGVDEWLEIMERPLDMDYGPIMSSWGQWFERDDIFNRRS